MIFTQNVHQQFAEYFQSEPLKPYIYLLSKKLNEGHVCIHLDEIDPDDLDGLYDLPHEPVAGHDLVSNGSSIQPFVLQNGRLYIYRYYRYESILLDRIMQFIRAESMATKKNFDAVKSNKTLIDQLFNTNSPGTDWQKVAALVALIHQFTVITGGPGTGKTTTVAKILALMYAQNPLIKVALSAPTGKAAARMAESLKTAPIIQSQQFADIKELFETLEPSTIHRLLGYQKDRIYFKYNKEKHLPYDVVIVDETSMTDLSLFAKLMEAIGPETKLILLGDKNQLASVEAGSLFGDLCQAQEKLNTFSAETAVFINSFAGNGQELTADHIGSSSHPLFGHVIELQKSHRFSDTEGIGRFSKAIINNDVPVLQDLFENKDPRVIVDTNYSENIFNDFVDAYRNFISEKDILLALKKLNEVKVLCAVREGDTGLAAINRKIESRLKKRGLINPAGEQYENRPIMITRNYYDLGLFNGDTGIVRRDANGDLKAWFEEKGQLKPIAISYIPDSETAFAMTIHKSQGSEFRNVMVILPDSTEVPVLTRELLYTAVTRAKEHVIVQGPREVILHCAAKTVKRGSGLTERFMEITN